jgi:hypothetical protein
MATNEASAQNQRPVYQMTSMECFMVPCLPFPASCSRLKKEVDNP